MLDKDLKIKARALYMQGTPLAEISEKLAINIHTLKHWADKGSASDPAWKVVKGAQTDERLLALLKTRGSSLEDAFALGMNALVRGLAHIEINNVVLETSAMTQLVKIMESIDKWQRLKAEEDEILEEEDTDIYLTNHPFFKEES